MRPFISVIVPFYNAEKTISRCIDSVLNQDFSDYEIVLVDDGSEDEGAKICDFYASENDRIQVIHRENQGVSAARNIGLDLSVGEYICFLDADDWIEDRIFYHIHQLVYCDLYQQPDLILTSFYKEYIGKSEYIDLFYGNKLEFNLKNQEFNPYHTRILGCVWGKFYRRDLTYNIRFDTKLSLCEDAEYNFRVYEQADEFCYINKPSYHYVYSAGSTINKYKEEYMERYCTALSVIQHNEEVLINPMAKDAFYQFSCNVFNVIAMNVIFARTNQAGLMKKMNCMKGIRTKGIFEEAMKKIKLSSLPLPHRCIIICGKFHFYFGIYIVSLLNRFRSRRLY